MSPYIFIIGAELFVRMIKVAQLQNSITGLPVDNKGEIIGQLAYVDYCLLIAGANLREANALTNIITRYCSCSDQKG